MTKKQKAELQEMYSEAIGDFEKFFKSKKKAMKSKCKARREAKSETEQIEKKDQQE